MLKPSFFLFGFVYRGWIYRLPSCVFGIVIGHDRNPVINPPGFHGMSQGFWSLIWVGSQVLAVPEFANYTLPQTNRKSTHENRRLVQMKIPFAFWPIFRGELLVLGRVFQQQILGKWLVFHRILCLNMHPYDWFNQLGYPDRMRNHPPNQTLGVAPPRIPVANEGL